MYEMIAIRSHCDKKNSNWSLDTQHILKPFIIKKTISLPKYSGTQLKRQCFMRHLAYNVRYSKEPINTSLSIITLHYSVTKTPVYNDTKYSVPSHNIITEFQCINTAFSEYLTRSTRSSPKEVIK
jgi:hypothetical protein